MIKFVVVIIICMMLLCPYFVFIDASLSLSLSKHMDMFFDIGFLLEDKRGLRLQELIRPFGIMFSYCYL